jgi:hypothetical protein
MSIDSLLLAYVVSLLAVLGALALYSEFRRLRIEPAPSEDRLFRCEACAYVYTDDADVERSRCPQCGTLNTQISF